MASVTNLVVILAMLLLLITSTLASPIPDQDLSSLKRGNSIFDQAFPVFNSSLPMIAMDVFKVASASETQQPTTHRSEPGLSITVCIPINGAEPKDFNMCIVSFYTHTTWSHGKLLLFDHNCVSFGSNSNVDLQMLKTGVVFKPEQLPHFVGVHVALEQGTMLVQYDDGWQGRGELSAMRDRWGLVSDGKGGSYFGDLYEWDLSVWGRDNKVAWWSSHANHTLLGGKTKSDRPWNSFMVPFYC